MLPCNEKAQILYDFDNFKFHSLFHMITTPNTYVFYKNP